MKSMESDEVGRLEAMQTELKRLQDAHASGTMSPGEFAREMSRLAARVFTSTSLASGAVPGMPGMPGMPGAPGADAGAPSSIPPGMAGFFGLPAGLPGAGTFGPGGAGLTGLAGLAGLAERLKKGIPPQDDK